MTKKTQSTTFFLLFEDGSVRRIATNAGVQATLSAFFGSALSNFLSEKDRVHFGGALTADEDELLEIADFNIPDAIKEAHAAPLAADVVTVKTLGMSRPKAIFSGDSGGHTFAFQVLEKRQVFDQDTFTLLLSGDTFTRLEQPAISVGERLHAVIENHALLFESYFIARRIFALGEYYRVASDADLTTFTSEQLLSFPDPEAFRAKADEWTRRRVAVIHDSEVLKNDVNTIRKVAKDFDIDLPIKNGKIVIPPEKKAFKNVIRLLSDDLLLSPLTGNRFVSASKRLLPKKK